ncbi:MAG: hypothetical protein WC651_02815 [Candidatus Gracilibacteria bacterium]|jgi:hypothetical protein
MSVVVGYHLGDWAVIMADSRATRQNDGAKGDCLQKLHKLNNFVVAGYASNNAVLSEDILEKFEQKLNDQPLNLEDLKKNFSDICRKQDLQKGDEMDFLVVFTDKNGVVDLSVFKYMDNFSPFSIVDSFEVIGSGSSIEDLLDEKNNEIFGSKETKQYVQNQIVMQVNVAISQKDKSGEYVGGMLQAYRVDKKGIRPIRQGQFSVEPEGGFSYEMRLEGSVWTQRDLSSNRAVPLVTAKKLKNDFIEEIFDTSNPKTPPTKNVYLSYFIPSLSLKTKVGCRLFEIPYQTIVVQELPKEISLRIYYGLRSVSGNFSTKIVIKNSLNDEVFSHEELVPSSDPVNTTHLNLEAKWNCAEDGMYFIELYINDLLTARKPLFVKKSAIILPRNILDDEMKKHTDLVVQNNNFVNVDYFDVCHNFLFQENKYEFQHIVFLMITPKFPFVLEDYDFVVSFRASVGEHRVNIVLNDLQGKESHVLSDAIVKCNHSCLSSVLVGKIPVLFNHDGVYRLDLMIDGQFQTSKILFVDDISRTTMYSLLPDQIREAHAQNRFFVAPEDAYAMKFSD